MTGAAQTADAALTSGKQPSADTAETLAEIEIKRQRSAWQRFCRGRRRRPVLTRAEKRRAASICISDAPREILACAWVGATDRDRRDLLARVTGRVDA